MGNRLTGRPDIETATLAGIFTGAAAAVYPALALVTKKEWDWEIWITAIQFSTSLTIFPTDLGGMILTLGKQPLNLSVDPGLSSVIAHITAPNSISGASPLANPSSKVSNIVFGDCGYFLQAGAPLSLYAFANATAGNYLFAISSIQYRRTK